MTDEFERAEPTGDAKEEAAEDRSGPAGPGGAPPGSRSRDEPRIERRATLVRLLLTLLFYAIAETVGALLSLLVIFELGYTLVTERAPSYSIRRFANQVVAYLYRVYRYVTYNESEPPFPFRDFPAELEPPTEAYGRRDGSVPGLSDRPG